MGDLQTSPELAQAKRRCSNQKAALRPTSISPFSWWQVCGWKNRDSTVSFLLRWFKVGIDFTTGNRFSFSHFWLLGGVFWPSLCLNMFEPVVLPTSPRVSTMSPFLEPAKVVFKGNHQ